MITLLLTMLGADLWVYTQQDDYRSAQVVEAVSEPMGSLRERLPQNAAIVRYLDELEVARAELSVSVLDRDEAGIHWEVECPAYGLSRYETPRTIRRDALYHPLLIVEHLKYISTIADHDFVNRKWRRQYVSSTPKDSIWMEWHTVAHHMVVDGPIHTEETLDVLYPVIKPEPPAQDQVRWPWRLRTIYSTADRILEYVERYSGSEDEALRAIDMGTGIIAGDVE